jgi:ABC-2 type transport system permease protein
VRLDDVGIIARKEFREILTRGRATRNGKPRTARRSLLANMAFPIFFGVVLGVGAAHGGSSAADAAGTALFPVAMLALNVTGGLSPDAVAGERERHTLETLLATPVSDTDILFGKLAAVVGYGWLLSLAEIVVVEAAATIAGGGRSPFHTWILFAVAVLSLLEAFLSGALGALVSVRSPTVRAAQRSMALFTMIAGFIAGIANVGLVLFARRSVGLIAALGFAACLLVIDSALLGTARLRFRRGRLLLD